MNDNLKCLKNVTTWNSQLGIAPRTFEEFACWIHAYLEFKIPWSRHEQCQDHEYPLNAMWEAYAEIESFSIWLANRGGGKTWDLSVLSFMETLFKPKCGINILGGSLEQSKKAIKYLTEFWSYDNAPKHLLINKEVTKRGYELINGSWVTALAASSKSVRSSHQPKLRVDEADEVEKSIYLAALGQPKTMNGINENVIVSSTLHNAFGLMSDIIDTRYEKKAKLFTWCVNEVKEPHGFWTEEEIETKKRWVTEEMFDAEFLCKRPKISDTVFDFVKVDKAYNRGRNDKFDKNVWTEAGLDWGYACTALSIIQDNKEVIKNVETYTYEFVELNDRCKQLAKICINKNIKRLFCDSNPKDSNITLKKIFKEKRVQTQVIPVAFNKFKNVGINVLRLLLDKNKFNITNNVAQRKMKAYHFKDPEHEVIDKVDDHIPDSLIAWASSRMSLLGRGGGK